LNEGFVCENCGKAVMPAPVTFRNHCPFCLISKHVDSVVPGDRLEKCGGLMTVIAIEGSDPDKLDLVHQCAKCHYTARNKVALDDTRDIIFKIQKFYADSLNQPQMA
jgi:hypothetical protein